MAAQVLARGGEALHGSRYSGVFPARGHGTDQSPPCLGTHLQHPPDITFSKTSFRPWLVVGSC
jgi:hypothetical protein